jgi:DNA-binding transcriptional ArsR family regulator
LQSYLCNMPVSVQPARELDARSLLALAHPLRIRLLDSLTRGGPATATQLAAALGESSGATSYHLRILARHGFVAEEPDRGTKRERFWRAAAGGIHLRGFEFLNDETTRAATRLLVGEVHRQAADQLERWFNEGVNWPREWQESSSDSVYSIELTADQASALRDELKLVLDRYRSLPPDPGSRQVEIQVNLFPTGDPP